MAIYNQSYGGFRRRKLKQEEYEKKEAERKAKLASEPRKSPKEINAMIAMILNMAQEQQDRTDAKIRERREKNNGW